MVLCVIHAVFVGMRRIMLPQRSFTSTYSGLVSCPAIIVGPSMKKSIPISSSEANEALWLIEVFLARGSHLQ
jgi:hypothetical protein